jgi:hypothetical protein
MLFRRLKKETLPTTEEGNVVPPVALALSVIDSGIRDTRTAREKAVRLRTVVEELMPDPGK